MSKSVKIIIAFFVCFLTNQLYSQSTNSVTTVDTKKIVYVYGSADCHYCQDAKKTLTEHNIGFVFYDIDIDKNALKEMLFKLKNANQSTKNLGIPVIDKYGEIFSNNSNFDDFLKKLIQ